MRNEDSRDEAPGPRSTGVRWVLPLAAILTAFAATGSASPLSRDEVSRVAASHWKLPLHFEPNLGQTDDQVQFLARGLGYGLFLTSTESVLVLRARETAGPAPSRVLRLKLLGASPRPAFAGREELPARSHYFIGNDPKGWRTDVPHYARAEYADVYPGVSLAYYGNEGQLEYDFVVSPSGDPTQIRIGVEGAEHVRVDAAGDLVLSLPEGDVVQHAPVAYQETAGGRTAVESRFVLRGPNEVGFEVGRHEPDRPLVLDPVLSYSTYLGGSDSDQANAIAVDSAGNAYVAGLTTSANFPILNPAQGAAGFVDAFVAKINAAGTALVYSTYLGGTNLDEVRGIAVDGLGNAYLTGRTISTNFPTVNPFQAVHGGGLVDAFVAKLSPSGSALVYSTYFGGRGNDIGMGIAVNAAGNAHVTGVTASNNFPTARPIQPASGGGEDAFVAELTTSGSALVYSTYLGGADFDGSFGISLDGAGNAYVAGATFSSNFPTAQPLQAAKAGDGDAFVTKLSAGGTALVYSTYLGGNGYDQASAIAVDGAGNAHVAGFTTSTDLPTASPVQAANGGSGDAFVARLNAAGSALVYSTYLGGSNFDQALGIAVDGSGRAHVTGQTGSPDFPTAKPFQAAIGGNYDAFVSALSPAGSSLFHSTFLGGSAYDVGTAIALDSAGNALVAGVTSSTNFPTSVPQTAPGNGDAFVTKMDLTSIDLTITKTDGQAAAAPGSLLTYTITVTNGGLVEVTGANVTDNFPAALTGVTWTCTASAGSSCGSPSGSGNIARPINLLSGGTATFLATGMVNLNASGTLSNTAAVAPPVGVTDPNLANNSATDTDTLAPQADLSITKTDGLAAVVAGEPVTYTIVAANAGPSNALGATVTDTVPASLTGASWTCAGAGGGTCAAAGAGNINDVANLPPGASVTYTLSGTVSALATGNLNNTAAVAPPGGTADPNPGNNSATDTDPVVTPAANNNTPSSADYVQIGSTSSDTLGVAPADQNWFRYHVVAGRSYCVTVDNGRTDTTVRDTVLSVFAADAATVLGANDDITDEPGGSLLSRVCYIAAATEDNLARVTAGVNPSGTPGGFRVRVVDTTLFCPWFFSGNGFEAFVLIKNTTGTAHNATVTLIGISGATLGTQSGTAPANGSYNLQVSFAPPTGFGLGTAQGGVSIAHDGPPGSMIATVTSLGFSSGVSFDTPASPRPDFRP